MTGTVSKLPSAQIARRAELEAEAAARGIDPNAPPVATTPTTNEPAPGNEPPIGSIVDTPEPIVETNDKSATVTLSREELLDLRAKAEKTTTAEGKAELAAMELAEAQAALTALRDAPKGTVVDAPPSAPAAPEAAPALRIEPGDTALTADEQENYGEAEPVVAKLIRRELASLLNPQFEALQKQIDALKNGVKEVSTTTARTDNESFVNKVKEVVPNFDDVVKNKHWNDFLDSRIPGAGVTQRTALAKAHFEKNIEDMKFIFKTFSDKYLEPVVNNGSGFESISVSGGEGKVDNSSPKGEMLKMSERRKASDDFLKGRITGEQLELIKEKYKKADSEGRVDYNN